MKLAHPDLRSRLAAEYVLGTMKGGARRRFQEYLKRDGDLQNEVARWEAHLTPLAERLPSVEPPARVWSRIEARIDRSSTKPGHAPSGFWRALAFGASGLAAALLIALVTMKPVEEEPMLMAVLAEENNDARVYIEQHKSNTLMVKMLKPWRTNSGFAHELWVIPKNGAPRSLGVIAAASDTRISVAELDARMANGAMLAVSLEPPGGSRTGAPTGKVVCKGTIAWMPPKPAKPRPQT